MTQTVRNVFLLLLLCVCCSLFLNFCSFCSKIRQRNNPDLFITGFWVLFILLWKYRIMTFCTIHNSVNNQKWNKCKHFSTMRHWRGHFSMLTGNIQIFSHVHTVYLQSHSALCICICETADLLLRYRKPKMPLQKERPPLSSSAEIKVTVVLGFITLSGSGQFIQ